MDEYRRLTVVPFLAIAGHKALTTCSSRIFEYVKSLGAAEIYNYNDSQAATKVREKTNNKLKLAWNTISEKNCARFEANKKRSICSGQRSYSIELGKR